MFETFAGKFDQVALCRAKSYHSGAHTNCLRKSFFTFLQGLPSHPHIIDKLELSKPTPKQPLKRKLTREGACDQVLETQPPRLLLHYKTSIEERMDSPDIIGSGPLSSGLLISAELGEPASDLLLISTDRLTIDHLEELFQEADLEIGFTAVLLLCKYFKTTEREPRQDTLLRLFVAATLVAFKFSYELVSSNFHNFLSVILGTDTATVNALQRHFLKALDYDLHVTPQSLKKLIGLLVQQPA